MNLFKLLCRGATVYLPQANIAEAESLVLGKVPPIRGKMVHFPGKNSENGGKINIFEGKVHRMTGKVVHFPSSGWTMPLPVNHIVSTVKSVH